MAEGKEIITSEERARFFSLHYRDVRTYTGMPLYFLMLFAPRFYHAPVRTVWAYVACVLVIAPLAGYFVGKWADARTGIVKAGFRALRRDESAKEKWTRRSKIVCWIFAATTVQFLVSVFVVWILDLPNLHEPRGGWLERDAMTWATLAVMQCIRIACDSTNLRMRRRHYACGAAAITVASGVSSALPHANASVMLSFAIIMFVLCLLDLRMMLQFAPSPEPEEAHA